MAASPAPQFDPIMDEELSEPGLQIASTDQCNALSTKGIRQNRSRTFALELSGTEIYGLLGFLEQAAVREASFPRLREAVLFAEMIRVRAKRQGF